jgi:hypothetical protein
MTTDPLAALLDELTPKLARLGPLDDELLAGLDNPRLSPARWRGNICKAGRLQRALLIRLRVHEREGADGLPTNNRFLFYELEQVAIVSKQQRPPRRPGETPRLPHQDTTDASADLRRAGIVPWWWIEDETRELTQWRFSPTVAEYVLESVDRATVDRWAGQPPPLIICESRSLKGVLEDIAARYCCPITSTNGQSLGHVVSQIAPLLQTGRRLVLYLGDFDLSGNQIEQATKSTLAEHGAQWLSWQRVALRDDQVAALEADRLARGVPGDLVIRKTDRRYRPAREFDAVECETVGQGPLRRLLTAALDELLAPVRIEDVLERQEAQRAQVAEQLRRLT